MDIKLSNEMENMIKQIMLILLLVLAGCSKNAVETSEEIVCSTPYIRYEASCCLDQNTNSICDVDEVEKVEELPIKDELPLATENVKPVQVSEKCELPSDIKCVNYKYSENALELTIQNIADFDMNAMDIILEAEECSSKGALGKPLLAGEDTIIKLVCQLEEGFIGEFIGHLRFIYRNSENQEYQNKKGLVVLNI